MNRSELINLISQEIESLENKSISRDTDDWYLYHHLNKFLHVVEQENNPSELLQTGDSFNMFCIDSMNWDTSKFKNLIEFGHIAVKIAKEERRR